MWDVQEDWTGQQTGVSVADDGVKGTTDQTRSFNLAGPFTATTNDALFALGIRSNDAHPQNPALRARRFDVTQTGPGYFNAVVGYQAAIIDPNDPAENPLVQPAVITVSSLTQEVEVDFDVNDNPIATVNGEPLEGVTRPFTDMLIDVEVNLPDFDFDSISTYTNKVNSTPFKIRTRSKIYEMPAGTTRISDLRASNVFTSGFEYWKVNIQFHVRRGAGPVTDAKAWWHRTAHKGYRVRTATGPPLVTDIAKDGDFTVAQPVFLIKTGADIGKREPDPTVGHFIEFEVLESIDFNNLNLMGAT